MNDFVPQCNTMAQVLDSSITYSVIEYQALATPTAFVEKIRKIRKNIFPQI